MREIKKAKLRSIYGGEPFRCDNALKFWKILPDLILFLIFLLYLSLSLIFFTTYSYYVVQHTSMQPLLNNYTMEEINQGISDAVYVNTYAKAVVGDVVVVNSNNLQGSADTVVKRLIAVGGDKLTIRETVLLDGVTKRYDLLRIPKGNTTPYIMVENYVPDEKKVIGMKNVFDNFHRYLSDTENQEYIGGHNYLVLQDDEIFYMGDNRGYSFDCSEYGPVKSEYIVGRVEIIIFRQQNMFFHIFEFLLGFKSV